MNIYYIKTLPPLNFPRIIRAFASFSRGNFSKHRALMKATGRLSNRKIRKQFPVENYFVMWPRNVNVSFQVAAALFNASHSDDFQLKRNGAKEELEENSRKSVPRKSGEITWTDIDLRKNAHYGLRGFF